MALSKAQMLGRHLQKLVVSEETQRLLQAQPAGRGQAYRDIRGRRTNVGLLLLPADIDPYVARTLLDADDHPLVHRLPRLDECGAALLRAGQPEGERGAW